MWDKKRRIYYAIICFFICLHLSFLNQDCINHNLSIDKNQMPNTSQLGSNFTLNVIKPDLFFIEGRLGINISSAVSGNIFCALAEQSGEQYFIKINQSVDIIGDNQSKLIILKVIPLIATFPGEYHFTLNITGFFNYGIRFDMFLGMGYSLFSIILTFIAIIVIIAVLNYRHSKKTKEPKEISAIQTTKNKQSLAVNLISCPNCKQMIEEGLSFCPECGERIPEFLRYNPK